jgi:hypothetical protein
VRKGGTLSPERSNEELPAAVPRRFGVGTLLVISAAYAALFGGLRAIGYPGVAIAAIAIFLTAAGLGQMIFGQRAARLGSMVAGAIMGPVIFLMEILMLNRVHRADDLLAGLACWITTGGVFGYFAGTLVAGIFLVMDALNRLIHGDKALDQVVNAESVGEKTPQEPDKKEAQELTRPLG